MFRVRWYSVIYDIYDHTSIKAYILAYIRHTCRQVARSFGTLLTIDWPKMNTNWPKMNTNWPKMNTNWPKMNTNCYDVH